MGSGSRENRALQTLDVFQNGTGPENAARLEGSKPPSVEDAKDAGMVRSTPGRRSLEPAFGQPRAVAASEPSSEASAAADALVASALAVVLAAKADTGGAGICEHGTLDVGVGVCFLMLTRRTITSHRASIEATTARPCEELANLRGPHSSFIICLGRFTFSTQPDSENHASRSTKREPARSCTAGWPAHMSDRTRLTWTPHGRAFAHASAGQ